MAQINFVLISWKRLFPLFLTCDGQYIQLLPPLVNVFNYEIISCIHYGKYYVGVNSNCPFLHFALLSGYYNLVFAFVSLAKQNALFGKCTYIDI